MFLTLVVSSQKAPCSLLKEMPIKLPFRQTLVEKSYIKFGCKAFCPSLCNTYNNPTYWRRQQSINNLKAMYGRVVSYAHRTDLYTDMLCISNHTSILIEAGVTPEWSNL